MIFLALLIRLSFRMAACWISLGIFPGASCQYSGEPNSTQSAYIRDILGRGGHLLELINNVLNLSKVEAGQMELEAGPVEIAALLEDSLLVVKDKCLKHGIRLETTLAEKTRDQVVRAGEGVSGS